MSDTDDLYTINDSLGQLANDLGVYFKSPEDQDRILNDLTHQVAEAFGRTGEEGSDGR